MTMDTQDVLLCSLCKTSAAPMHCRICHTDLCKDCVEKHILDVSKDHKVVPLKQKGSTPDYPICSTHSKKYCELHCQECDIPICVQCVASQKHKGHEFVDMVTALETKKDVLQKDLRELEKSIYPKYQDIASTIPLQKANMKVNSQNLITALNKQAEELHQEIDSIINKLKSDLDEMDTKYLALLNKEENDITHRTSEITQTIADLKKLLDSNDICIVSTYKSRNDEFRKLPPKIKATLPSFSPHNINRDTVFQQFGSLSALFYTIEEHDKKVENPGAKSSSSNKLLRNEPSTITEINTENSALMNVACLEDDKIWTSGLDKIMRLYNLQGELVKSIHTKSGNNSGDN